MAWVSTLQSSTQHKNKKIKLLNRKKEVENKETVNKIKNENKIKQKILAWVSTLQSLTQHKKRNRIMLRNRNTEIEILVTENDIKNQLS